MTHPNTLDLLQEVFVYIADEDLSDAVEQIINEFDETSSVQLAEVLTEILDTQDLSADLAEQVAEVLEGLPSEPPPRKRSGAQPLRIW